MVTVLGGWGDAGAVQRMLAVVDQAVITDLKGQSRILLKFEPVDDLKDEWISSATLTIPLAGVALTEDLELQIDVPRSAWDGSATWNGPWFKPGGDPYDTQAVDWTIEAGGASTEAAVDVTHLVRAIQTGETPNNGFLIWTAVGGKTGFSVTEMAGLGLLSKATVEVTYRKITEISKVGAQEMLARKRTRTAGE
jgi:hypothetical protein